MNERDRVVVPNAFRVLGLKEQHHDGLIDDMEFAGIKVLERIRGQHHLGFDCAPRQLKESCREFIGPWCLVR
jgi:hypothetical protein